MGINVHLNWKEENNEEKWVYLFKHSFYPLELQDYDIPDESLPDDLDAKFIESYLEWLKKLLFFIKFAPEKYMSYNKTSNDIETIKKSIQYDICQTQEAINTRELLKLKKIKVWLSVG